MLSSCGARPYTTGNRWSRELLDRPIREHRMMHALVTHHRKALLAMIFAQLGCLACGLWMQDHFVVAAAKWASRDDAVSSTAAPSGSSLLEAMPHVRPLSLIWIGGLQGTIAYLFFSRFQNSTSERQAMAMRELMRRERELLRTRNAVIFGLAKLAEYRDPDTGQHLERIALYCTRLAGALRRHPRYRGHVSTTFVKTIGVSSVLHDIGKVAIEDAILCKPGKLTQEERSRMEQHTLLAGECIAEIERHLGKANFLQMAREIALCHHEHWDGKGYPNGLSGEDIPLSARIVAIADIYDALASKRVYKESFSHERCVSIIRAEAGQHLDPYLVEVFLSIHQEFAQIARQFTDESRKAGQRAVAQQPQDKVTRDTAPEKRTAPLLLELDDAFEDAVTTAG